MSNFDELDEMTGSMSDWVSKKQGATSYQSEIEQIKAELNEIRQKLRSLEPISDFVEVVAERAATLSNEHSLSDDDLRKQRSKYRGPVTEVNDALDDAVSIASEGTGKGRSISRDSDLKEA